MAYASDQLTAGAFISAAPARQGRFSARGINLALGWHLEASDLAKRSSEFRF